MCAVCGLGSWTLWRELARLEGELRVRGCLDLGFIVQGTELWPSKASKEGDCDFCLLTLTHIITAAQCHPLGAQTILDSPQGDQCQFFSLGRCLGGIEWAATSPGPGATWSTEGGTRSSGLVSATPKAWQLLSYMTP